MCKGLIMNNRNNYFGARYYDADISIWLSVDPMADKAPGWTPYRYGLNNPLNNIDKKGLIEWPLAGATAVNKSDTKDGGWKLVNTVVRTSTYLDTNRPKGASNPHCGIDYRAQVGTTFYSLGDGVVTAIGSSKRGGNYVTVQYSNGDQVTFRHIQATAEGLKVGSTVLEGQRLGTTGNSGTQHAHLHVDARDKDGNRIDPEGRNYGTVNNSDFFSKFNGDYMKLFEHKQEMARQDSQRKAAMLNPPIHVPDATNVVTPYTNYTPQVKLDN
jgi:murein DD-endopeptidase MepM/ murein hydrolase activator NlpD